MDPKSPSAEFEAMQPPMSATDGLKSYVAYVVNFARLPRASNEVAWSQTLVTEYLGPYQ